MKKNISKGLVKRGIKRGITLLSSLVLVAITLAACGSSNDGGFDPSQKITVVSREDGSGTRGAFIELFGIEEKMDDGTKADRTTEEASIAGNTATMMTTVANSEYAIGYVSLGSLNDTIKALEIDGAKASQDSVKNGTYKIVRPFNIVTQSKISDIAEDFIKFILSTEGQKVVSENGYIALEGATNFSSNNASGKIIVAGSSSVSPVMEKLKEAYVAINKGAEIEIQTSDSSTGVASVINGTSDIGMASRELNDSETKEGVSSTVIAQDGIAVIVNNASPLTGLTSEQINKIFTGDVNNWDGIIK